MLHSNKTRNFLFSLGIFLFAVIFSKVNAQLLWEISGNGLTKSSYLYGTLHVAPEKEFYLNPNVQKVMKNCDVLAFEVVVKLKDVIAMAPMMVLDEGKTIKNYLSETDFQRFKDYCLNTVKMKEKKFNRYMRLKPFFISSDLLIQQLGKTKSVEKELEKMANKNKMSVVGLESISFQLETINGMPVEDSYRQLMRDLGNEVPEFRKLLNYYRKEELNTLFALIEESEKDMPGFTELFLNIRNRNWIPVIESLVKEKSAFIAVGAAHLPGEEGVINLLIKQGYNVKPLR